MSNILAFAGSARSGSFNRKLLEFVAELARERGAAVTTVDLRDFPLPIYDGDLEVSDGIPAAAESFYQLLKSHAGFLIACPEYNSSITPLLKNTIDWASRPRAGDPPLAAFQGKVAGLVATSPGALGGLRGLVHVRAILGNIGVHVIPSQVAVGRAGESFDTQGRVVDEASLKMLDRFADELTQTVTRLG